MSERVLVAMSGGVDSSVAAALLVEQGCEVIGVTMQLVAGPSRCCSLDDVDDARRVADRLGIRFYVASYTDEFRREVMEPFADEYLAGRTPIPCLACNRRFKFHHLLLRARALGASALATGHYARIDRSETGSPQLHRARDRAKDQSFFLFDLGPRELAQARFPLGDLTKPEVREIARGLGLATAEKLESQEICFVPDGDVAGAVDRIRPGRAPGTGDVVDRAGSVIGRHAGIHALTVGQRRGLGLSRGRRSYVTALDAETNRAVVGDADDLLARGARIDGISWGAGVPARASLHADVQVRHRGEAVPARLEIVGEHAVVAHFERSVRAVTPGQAAVFYTGDQVLGGGWIRGAIA